jgi:hypothetical protein
MLSFQRASYFDVALGFDASFQVACVPCLFLLVHVTSPLISFFLTIFLAVGGNHEASNYLWELYYGGWVAPRIYYLGHAGAVRVAGLRVAGLSGIYKDNHFNMVGG